MKNSYLLIILFSFLILILEAQPAYRPYLGAAPFHAHGNTSTFLSQRIAEDFGPRQLNGDQYDWHGGIDYNSGIGDADLGDLLLSLQDGIVSSHSIMGDGTKALAIEGNEHNIRYVHVFECGDPTVQDIQTGGCLLTTMDVPNNLIWCIVIANNGTYTAIGPTQNIQPGSTPTVTFMDEINMNRTVEVTNTVNAGDPIAPLGTSCGYPAHLHLEILTQLTNGGMPVNPGNDVFAKDPLQLYDHDVPTYNLSFFHQDDMTQGIDLKYPGTDETTLQLHVEMDGQANNAPANRYDVVMNVDNVEILLKREEESNFSTILGPNYESEFSHGARIETERSLLGLEVPNALVGDFNRTHMQPFAYAGNNTTAPRDEYYFADFVSRIHEDDSMQGSGSLMVADCPEDARYNDGAYEAKARVVDVQGEYVESDVTAFILDNFQPYLQSLTFSTVNGPVQYVRQWNCDECGISLSPNPVLEASKSDWVDWLSNEPELILDIISSEPLLELSLDIYLENTVLASNLTGTSLEGNTRWIFDIGSYADQLTGLISFKFSGQDTNGNELISFTTEQQNSCVSVPTRAGHTTWNNPDNLQPGADEVHSICIDCSGNRLLDNDCVYINLLPEAGKDCLDIQVEVNNASGNISNDGSISLNVSGGVPPYNYEWSHGATSASISGLSPGEYSVTITDGLCCVVVKRFRIDRCPDISEIYVAGVVTESDQLNNGAIDITLYNIASNSTVPSEFFDFFWTGPNGYVSNLEDIEALSPGTYCVTAEEKRTGCVVSSRCFSVCGSMILGINHNGFIECDDGLGTFEVTLMESNITAPYQIEWSNGVTTAVNENLMPGSYCVTVTDANGCADHLCLDMKVKYPIEIDGEVSTSGCNGNAGEINLVATSEGSQITGYQWSNGQTSASISNLPAGEYCVTVTNDKGCEKSTCYEVENIDLAIGIENITRPTFCSEPPCSEELFCSEDGEISISVQSNISELSYEWSGPEGYTSSDQDIFNLAPGTYHLTVSANDCSIVEEFNLPPCLSEVIIDYPGEEPGCDYESNSYNFNPPDGEVTPKTEGCDGAIELSYQTNNLHFSWSGPDGYVSKDKQIYNLCEGTYCVTVSNGCGLEKENCFEIVDCNTQNLSVSGTSSNSCPGYEAGTIAINVSGGSAPYEFQWSNGDNTDGLFGVSSGHYCVTVSDANGCEETACFEVGSEQAVSEWVGCTNVIKCNDYNVSATEYPTISIPSSLGCEYVDELCTGNQEVVGTQLVQLVPEYVGNCLLRLVNPYTGVVCETLYGEQRTDIFSGYHQQGDCWYCNKVSYCYFNDPAIGGEAIVILNSSSLLGISVVSGPGYDCDPGDCYTRIYCGDYVMAEGCSDGCSEVACTQGFYQEETVTTEVVNGNEVVTHRFSGETADETIFARMIEDGMVSGNTMLINRQIKNSNKETGINSTEILVEKQDSRSEVEVYPNPFEQNLVINCNLYVAQEIKIRIFNSTGQLMKSNSYSGDEGSNEIEFDMLSFSSGLYLIEVSIGKERYLKKVIKR